MSPELAEELQNAGFPNIQDLQHRQGRQFLASDGRISFYSLGELAPHENWFIPTLEELIEACGEKFDMLQSGPGYWTAWALPVSDPSKGAFPTEAVARLWLELHANGDATT